MPSTDSVETEPQVIPRDVEENEILVRAIFHPVSYSKGKLQPNAFMPPPGKKDVSLSRLTYTTPSFCKHHARTNINTGGTYMGLAVTSCIAVNSVNKVIQGWPDPLSIWVAGTPMDENNQYYAIGRIAYADALGSPMHADLLYSRPRTAVKGSPDKQIQQIAREILKFVNFHLDNHLDSQDWEDGDLTIV